MAASRPVCVVSGPGPSPVHNVSLSNRGSTSALHASWVDASGKKDGYRLVLYHLDSQVAVRNESVLADVSAFLFEGLLAGSEYALKITTLAGASQASTSLHQWTGKGAWGLQLRAWVRQGWSASMSLCCGGGWLCHI